MIPQSAALVEGVAQALTWAINDPLGHSVWNTSVCHSLNFVATADLKSKRLRGEKETMRAATVFDSSVVPPIGIGKYLMRLRATFRCSDASFIAAFILVDRVLGYDGGRLPISMRNVHRLYLASLVVAVKYHEDLVYTNSHYAKAGGVHLREVNRLERVLLSALDFDLRVPPEQYQIYEASLVSLCSGGAGGAGSAAPWWSAAPAVLTSVPGNQAAPTQDQGGAPRPSAHAPAPEQDRHEGSAVVPALGAANSQHRRSIQAEPAGTSNSADAVDDRAAFAPQLGGGGSGQTKARRRRQRPGRAA